MMNDIFSLFITAAEAVSSWFTRLFTATGATALYVGIILIILAFRFLFLPMVGRSFGSDMARKFKKELDDNE